MATTSTRRASSVYSRDDPFASVMRPPDSETESEKQARLKEESEAKRISDKIDEELKADREMLKSKKEDVRLLLLGQSESGKSTLQKQFQLLYAPNTLEAERASWRTVVYFNVICSVKRILEALDSAHDPTDDNDADGPVSVSPPTTPSSPWATDTQLANLRLRLSPLVAAESTLAQKLSGGAQATVAGRNKAAPVLVRSGWQANAFKPSVRKLRKGSNSPPNGEVEERDEAVENVARMIEACQGDIADLWAHEKVKSLIVKRRLRLEESAEYFLNRIGHITASTYVPTTDDILRARVQTMGIAEHKFVVTLNNRAVNWHLYDVGGARGQRHTWIPYFDDANAIIFVAPISAFDQYLDEDPRTNRIDDSLQLFTTICSEQLLKKVHLVLFLNKTDILKAKLNSGLKVNKYITSFANRPNDYETVTQYFRSHFLQVHRRNNNEKRLLYTHMTSVVDTKATQSIIMNVRDSIFRGYLEGAALIN